jgi:hypothetical protein
MTSARPESVTCLPCREHAARWHLANADDLVRLRGGDAPGLDLAGAAIYHRSQARKFAG